MRTETDQLRQLLLQKGSALVSYADLRVIPAPQRLNMLYGISIAVALSPTIISGIRHGPTQQYYQEYCRANSLLGDLSRVAARFLNDKGAQALAFAATNEGIFPDTLSTTLPHKTVATLSGLGWIGKCALLVTPDYGSAVRIGTVLTDAELTCGSPVTASQCGDCTACVDICPGHAATGQLWQQNLYRDTFFDPHRCRRAARCSAAQPGIDHTICGMCIAVCPWTIKYIQKNHCPTKNDRR